VTSPKDAPRDEPLLDAEAIRRLRLQAGLSSRRFARALGVSASTIRGLEEGSNHDQLPLTMIARLADLLGVAPQELFARARHQAVDPCADDRALEAALHCLPGVVPLAEVARALGWTLERARQTLEILDKRLALTGARLHRNGWQQCAIRPATEHLSDAQQQALHRIGPRDRGLTRLTARLLLAATRGEIDDHWFRTASNSEHVALQSLLKQGVLRTIQGRTQIVPAPDAFYGLDPDLSEPPDPGELHPVARPQEDHASTDATAKPTEQIETPT